MTTPTQSVASVKIVLIGEQAADVQAVIERANKIEPFLRFSLVERTPYNKWRSTAVLPIPTKKP